MMQRNHKICLGTSFAGCTLLVVCLIIALSTPWYNELTEVDGKIQTMVFEVSTHAFYWSYFCDGNSCNTFTVQGKPTNGVYSWYDVCQDCDSQLTLFVATWVRLLFFLLLMLIVVLVPCIYCNHHTCNLMVSSCSDYRCSFQRLSFSRCLFTYSDSLDTCFCFYLCYSACIPSCIARKQSR